MTSTAPARRPATERERRFETRFRPGYELDLALSIGGLRRGESDPTMCVAGDVIWRTTLTEAGVATLALRQVRGEVWAAAWGPGAELALEQVPRLCGADDDPAAFDPGTHRVIVEAHRRHPGLRLAATDQLADALISAILEQKVTTVQAYGAWRRLVTRNGIQAPGPTPRPMVAAPAFSVWRGVPSWDWHRAGVEPAQSATAVGVAARGDALSRALAAVSADGDRESVLTSFRGIGAWTAAEVLARVYGASDVVSVGDFHLAHRVGYALTGKRTDDAGMLDLLSVWPGQRQRVIRLIGASGVTEPRRAPRLSPEDHRRR